MRRDLSKRHVDRSLRLYDALRLWQILTASSTQPAKLVPSTMFRAGSELAEGARFIEAISG
jgi:hypothetical protein